MLMDRDPVIATLDIEYNELTANWKYFYEAVEPSDLGVGEACRPDSAAELVAFVQEAQNSSSSNVAALCSRFCSSLDVHRVLLLPLPAGEIYLSLFHGVLQSLIKASAAYPRIMERLLQALVEVGEAIHSSQEQQQHHHQRPLPSIVVRIYSLTFLLLGELMNWYICMAKCRLLGSHHYDLYEDVRTLVASVRRSTCSLNLGGCHNGDQMDCDEDPTPPSPWEASRLHQIGLQGQDRRLACQNALTRRLIWDIQCDAAQRSALVNEREALLSRFLEAITSRLQPVDGEKEKNENDETSNSRTVCLLTSTAADLDHPRFEWKHGSKRKLRRSQLQLASKHFQSFFDDHDQRLDFDVDVDTDPDHRDLPVEQSVFASLHQWVVNPQILSIGGDPTMNSTGQTYVLSTPKLISAYCVHAARTTNIPLISHFCTLPVPPSETKASSSSSPASASQGLIRLAYSLIRQLINHLPPVFDCDAGSDLSSERFRRFDGSLKVWADTLSLLDSLLSAAPPLLLCVIDGVDVLLAQDEDEQRTREYLFALLRVLRTFASRNRLKVLLTLRCDPSVLAYNL
ncbi:hypothetical protein ASPZODRAFT_142402 [Penicilliopsis zonata CBS 506.65]|uniref:Uncharacterized protein n=1 Tax=Penicilliopsis zonata CBS 506.65 TaxID=1073090 RepID=A0A1L9SHM1_9EURO|nr:hypothetical protein ASPZODRAFT_142402 [Penicilliopsis zonata CBS 506.65]OJJ46596.1 hypothetical protein ASPZODRAFT_142402 [Penicilliopsis zonata CBS 506.65]